MIGHHIGPLASGFQLAALLASLALTINNPGAESSGTGWTFTGGASTTTTQTNGAPRTGSRFFYNGASGLVSSMSQTITIPTAGQFGVDNFAYNFVFDRYSNCQTTGQSGSWMQIDFLDAAGRILDRKITVYRTCTQNTWTLQTETMPIPPGTRSVKFNIFMQSIGFTALSSKVYLDDLAATFVQAANTPKVDYSRSAVIMGSRVNALALREAQTYAVLGVQTKRLNLRDATAYFIVKP